MTLLNAGEGSIDGRVAREGHVLGAALLNRPRHTLVLGLEEFFVPLLWRFVPELLVLVRRHRGSFRRWFTITGGGLLPFAVASGSHGREHGADEGNTEVLHGS